MYYGTSALLPDTDRDGLNDKEEIENWFNPKNPDEDGDNRLDRQEFDEGTNPYVYDKDWKEQREDFFWGFADGLVRGDYIKEPESFAVVAGQITSGFVPYIEIRDILGNLHHNDFAFAGINLMGLLSFSGDTAKLTGRVTKFIVSNMDNLPEIGKLFGFMAKNCPDILKTLCKDEEVVKALKQAVDTDTAKLTKKEAEALENTLREVGVDVTIKGGKSSVELKEVFNSIKDSPNYPEGFQPRVNGTTGNKVNNQQLLEKLREIEAGTWKKVYKDGYDAYGNEISIHYFQSQSGKVFNVKVKSGWSN